MKILVLGAGLMGEPMARLFLQAGHDIFVLKNRNPEPIARLVAEGAIEVRDIEKITPEIDVVFSMLPNLPQIEEWLFEKKLADLMQSGSLFLNMSTVSPVGIKQVANRLVEKGIYTIDAPVSGGTDRAITGTLTIMASGDKTIYEEYYPLLKVVGEQIFYTGEIGNGQVIKLCNNLLASIIMAANAEILSLGVKSGADATLIRDVLLASTGGNRLLQDWIPKTMLQNNYEPGFMMKLMQKDIGLAMEQAEAIDVSLWLGALTKDLFNQISSEKNYAENDYSVIAKLYEQANEVQISPNK